MKIKPEKWTHHHIARTIHLSVLTTMLLVFILVCVELFSVISITHANPVSLNTTITAQVGDISEGPTSTNGGGCCPVEPQKKPGEKPEAVLPTLEIDIDPVDKTGAVETVLIQNTPTEVSVIKNPRPLLFGSTNIYFANLTLDVASNPKILSSTQADADGKWQWRMPKALQDGVYTISITATDPQIPTITITKSFSFLLRSESKQDRPVTPGVGQKPTPALVSLTARVPKEFKVVKPGEHTSITVELKPVTKIDKPITVLLNFVVESRSEQTLTTSEQTVTVNPEGTIIQKRFYTNKGTQEGRYIISASISESKKLISAQDWFLVKADAPAAAATVSNDLIYLIFILFLAALFLASLLLVLVELRKIKALTKTIQTLRSH